MNELPEGLILEDRFGSTRECYVYTEPVPDDAEDTFGGFAPEPNTCEFVVRIDGLIEIASAGAPAVPPVVLNWLLHRAWELTKLRKGS